MKSLVLLSGGIDSAACVAFYLKLGHPVEGLFIDYGQPVHAAEKASAKKVARHYSIPVEGVVCQGPKVAFCGEVLARNAFLVMAAMLYKPQWTGLIALGVHAGTSYYDCSGEFVADISRIMDRYADGRIVLGAPFLHWTKAMVWEFCLQNDVPVDITWSCEVGPAKPCGTCLSCRDLEAVHARSTK
ncbi:MAG: 7-cyano-7-deazaguanine synthase [Acidobacteriia bacterium]|nr:7-cyano-7-deazaguanine synthase [Terriglobia bacterium]